MAGLIIRDNAIPHLERIRTGQLDFGSPRLIHRERRLPTQVHTQWQPSGNLVKAGVCPNSRIAEIQRLQVRGTSEIWEGNCRMETIFGMETILGAQTISEIETIVFVVTGINTSSRGNRAIGIAIGTDTATTGGTVTGAPSLTEAG